MVTITSQQHQNNPMYFKGSRNYSLLLFLSCKANKSRPVSGEKREDEPPAGASVQNVATEVGIHQHIAGKYITDTVYC